MKVNKKTHENGIVEYMLHDETHTLLRTITESLRQNPEITFVSYVEVHPLKTQFKLLVKAKNNNETELILKTIAFLRENVLKDYREEIKKLNN